ncbi:MAG: DUF2914 domain-containing protein [Elusimicrobia bacterium]|nr:DUF2914 domain-containing protein [Elusimicrobiota bacterium]
MKRIVLSVLMIAAMGWVQAASAGAGALKVEKVVTAAGVKDRAPYGIAAAFEAGTTEVFCWVQLSGVKPPVKLKFVWSRGGKVISEYTADIKVVTNGWWAQKKVQPGSWKVEVFAEGGESLGSANFTVGPVAAEKKAP